MKNLNDIKERYLREPVRMRVGHLASDLLRLSTFSEHQINAKVLEDVLEESKFFIEWTAVDVPSDIQALFAEIQPRLALWQRRILQQKENFAEIKELQKMAKSWSTQLIDMSGLVA